MKQAEEASFVDLIACERDCRTCSYAAALDCDGNCGVCPHNAYCPCVNPVVARSKTALRLIELRPILLQDLRVRELGGRAASPRPRRADPRRPRGGFDLAGKERAARRARGADPPNPNSGMTSAPPRRCCARLTACAPRTATWRDLEARADDVAGRCWTARPRRRRRDRTPSWIASRTHLAAAFERERTALLFSGEYDEREAHRLDQRRCRWHRSDRLGRDAAPHVPALGGATSLPDRDPRPARG